MTTKTIGGTVRDIADSPIINAEITVSLLTKVAFRTSDDSSLVPTISKFSAVDGTWTAVIECNDTITPEGTLYEIKEDYAFGGWKTYLIQVLSTLPVGTNQVLDLIVPELSPVGVVNSFLTQALADELYEPLGGDEDGGGVSVTEYIEETAAPASPTGPTVLAIRADSLSAQGSDGQWVALRVTSKGELYCKIMDSVTVLGPLTNAELRATPVPVSGTVVTGGLTDTQLRATPVPISGTVSTGGLTDAQLRATSVPTQATGNVASGVADSGNPVKVAGVYNGTNPTLTNAQRGDMQLDSRGHQQTALYNRDLTSGLVPNSSLLTDAFANPTTTHIGSGGFVFNGTSWDRVRSDGTLGGQAVGGSVASGAADSGNPVKVGGRYNTTPPTLTNGQRGDLQVGTRGSQSVTLFAADSVTPTLPAPAALGDATPNPTLSSISSPMMLFNGTTWDRARGTTAAGQLVNVSTLPTTPAGTAVIGKVAAEQVATAAPVQVAMSTTSATIKASNAARKGFMIFNDTAVPLFVKFGATASATSFNVKIPAAAVYEQPVPGGWVYTGVIDGILGSGTGNVYVTEV